MCNFFFLLGPGYIFTHTATAVYNPFYKAKGAQMYNFKTLLCLTPLKHLTFSLKTSCLKSCMTVPSVTVCRNVQKNWRLPVSTPFFFLLFVFFLLLSLSVCQSKINSPHTLFFCLDVPPGELSFLHSFLRIHTGPGGADSRSVVWVPDKWK